MASHWRCVGTGTGTDALAIALRALGIGAGDEVITAPLSAAYTALAIMATGSRAGLAIGGVSFLATSVLLYRMRAASVGTDSAANIVRLTLIASIVAISGIHLLKRFMEIGDPTAKAADDRTLMWLTIIHLTFVVSGVLMALMDWLQARAAK